MDWLKGASAWDFATWGTVIGLILALYQLHRMRGDARALAQIHSSLTTRYIGQFPGFCKDIVELLDRAKNSIDIMCDFPGYAAFTDPGMFLNYRQTIERKLKREGVRVSITCYDAGRRREFFDEGFRGTRTWDAWRRMPENAAHLRAYLRQEQREAELDTMTQARLGELLEQGDCEVLAHAFKGAEVKEMSAHLPVYFWLVDGMAAIFVFSVRAEQAFEHGFSTTDARFITALQDLRKRYLRENEERAMVRAA